MYFDHGKLQIGPRVLSTAPPEPALPSCLHDGGAWKQTRLGMRIDYNRVFNALWRAGRDSNPRFEVLPSV